MMMGTRRYLFALALLAALPAFAQLTPLDGRWALEIGDDPSGFGVFVALQQDAAGTIKDEYATKDVTPRLMLTCAPGSGEISARIDWQRFISSFNTEVGFKVDDGKTRWLKWGVDRSNKITLSPSADDTAALVELLGSGSRLVVEVTPYSESPVTVEYELAGFANGLARLAKECE